MIPARGPQTMFLTIIVVLSVLLESLWRELLTGGARGPPVNIAKRGILGAALLCFAVVCFALLCFAKSCIVDGWPARATRQHHKVVDTWGWLCRLGWLRYLGFRDLGSRHLI